MCSRHRERGEFLNESPIYMIMRCLHDSPFLLSCRLHFRCVHTVDVISCPLFSGWDARVVNWHVPQKQKQLTFTFSTRKWSRNSTRMRKRSIHIPKMQKRSSTASSSRSIWWTWTDWKCRRGFGSSKWLFNKARMWKLLTSCCHGKNGKTIIAHL